MVEEFLLDHLGHLVGGGEAVVVDSDDRNDFGDAIDFIGWYNDQSYRVNGIKKDDAYHLYLAYHEGQGGFKKRTFRNKQWLKDVAKKVSARSRTYRKQLNGCEKKLNRGFFGRLFSFS